MQQDQLEQLLITMQTSNDQQIRKQATLKYNELMSSENKQNAPIIANLLLQIYINPKYKDSQTYALFTLIKDIKRNGEAAQIFSMDRNVLMQQMDKLLEIFKQTKDKQLSEYLSYYTSIALGLQIRFDKLFEWLGQNLNSQDQNTITLVLHMLEELSATDYQVQQSMLDNKLFPLIMQYQRKLQTPEQYASHSSCICNYISSFSIFVDLNPKYVQQLSEMESQACQYFCQYIQVAFQDDNSCAKIIVNLSSIIYNMNQEGINIVDTYLDIVLQLLQQKVLKEESCKQLIYNVTEFFGDCDQVSSQTRKLIQQVIAELVPLTSCSYEEAEAELNNEQQIGEDVIGDDTILSYAALECINIITDLIGKKTSMLNLKKFTNNIISQRIQTPQQIDQCVQYTCATATCYLSNLRKDEVQDIAKNFYHFTELAIRNLDQDPIYWGKVVFDIIVAFQTFSQQESNPFSAVHQLIVETLSIMMQIQNKRLLNAAVTVYDDFLQSLEFDQVYLHNQLTIELVQNLLQGDMSMQSAAISILTTYIQFNDIQNQRQVLEQYLPGILQQYIQIVQLMRQQNTQFTNEQVVYIALIVEFIGILIGTNKKILEDKVDQIIDSVVFITEYAIDYELDYLQSRVNQCLVNISCQYGEQIAIKLQQLLPHLIKIITSSCRKIVVDQNGDEEDNFDRNIFNQKKTILFLLTQLCINSPQNMKNYVQKLFQAVQPIVEQQEGITTEVCNLYGGLLSCIAYEDNQSLSQIKDYIINVLLRVFNPYHPSEIAQKIKDSSEDYKTDSYDFISDYQTFDKSQDLVDQFSQDIEYIIKLDTNNQLIYQFLTCVQKQIQFADELISLYFSEQQDVHEDLIEDEQNKLKEMQSQYQERMKQISQIFNNIISAVIKQNNPNKIQIIQSCFQILDQCYKVDCTKEINQYKFCLLVDSLVDLIECDQSQLCLQIYEKYQPKIKQVLLQEAEQLLNDEEGNIDIFRTTFYLYNCLCRFQKYIPVSTDPEILQCAVQLLNTFKDQEGDQIQGIYDNIIMYLVNSGILAKQQPSFFNTLFTYMQSMHGDYEEVCNAISFCIDVFDKPEFSCSQDILLDIIVSKYFGPVYGFVLLYRINGYQNESHDKYFIICSDKFTQFYNTHKNMVDKQASKLQTQYTQQNYRNFINQ